MSTRLHVDAINGGRLLAPWPSSLRADRQTQARLKTAQLEQEGAKVQHRQKVQVPDDAPAVAEVVVDNKDIGFVREGQAAEIKLETFPFARYGTLPARVERVSSDAVPDEKRGAIYTASLAPLAASISIAGKPMRLVPGHRRSEDRSEAGIDLLLSPIQRTAQESGKER